MPTVDDAYRRMLAAIAGAVESVRFEFYIYKAGGPGERFRSALEEAARRGVIVRVLLDAFGSGDLSAEMWRDLRAAGGEVYLFNPGPLLRLPVRNHQKLLVVDESIAFLGGFNIGPEYEGDGVSGGWRDLGLVITGPAVAPLVSSFEAMWQHRDFHYYHGLRAIGARWRRRTRAKGELQVMSMGPGLGRNVFHDVLLRDVRQAREVLIVSAYFVPGLKLRRALRRLAQRGGRVRLILAGRTDIAVVQAAGRTYYWDCCAPGSRLRNTSRRYSTPSSRSSTARSLPVRPTSMPVPST